MKHAILVAVLLSAVSVVFGQATPPEVLNYQGVLRDASDKPLDGLYDMGFRFYDAPGDASCLGGTLLLTDAHEAAGTGAIVVTGGMFQADLGGGTLTPGASNTMAEVFRDYAAVWLEVTVDSETLCPRVRVMSAGYALNASHLGGLDAGNAAGQIPVSNGARNDDLDADMLDGYHGSSFGKKALGNTWTGANTFSNAGNSFTGDGSGLTGVTASNSDTLDGHDSSYFLDTGPAQQTKAGALTVQESTLSVPAITASASHYGIHAEGDSAGGYFADRDDPSTNVYVAYNSQGISAHGASTGGHFDNTRSYASVGHREYGVFAFGESTGGHFQNDAGESADLADEGRGISAAGVVEGGYFLARGATGKARCGYGDIGVKGEGFTAGGYFIDGDDTASFAYAGYASYGLWGEGSAAGGYFHHSNPTGGYARVAQATNGIEAGGSASGGFFTDTDNTGSAWIGYGDRGIHAAGTEAGGYFEDSNSSGSAFVAKGGYGVDAQGDSAGGRFEGNSTATYALVANQTEGIYAQGTSAGARFEFSGPGDDDSRAYIAQNGDGIDAWGTYVGGHFHTDRDGVAYAAIGNTGVMSSGSFAGGEFYDSNGTGRVYAGYGDVGVYAEGASSGGHFEDTGGTSWAEIAWFGDGISAHGNTQGGYFQDDNSSATAHVAYGTYKIQGSGSVSFVQNHPENPDRVIVYVAPEGDEAATYTRGTARLVAGEARVALGETFRWVTNPDIGLTAYLTPHGDCGGLYVDSLDTTELVVRELGGGTSDVTFDYIVYGLRLGFEEIGIVQEKREEARIPSMKDHRDLYAHVPELRSFNALERFKKMEIAAGLADGSAFDFGASASLLALVSEFDPAVHELPRGGPTLGPGGRRDGSDLHPVPSAGAIAAIDDSPDTEPESPLQQMLPLDADGNVYARSFRPSAGDFATLVAVNEPVEPGDVLVLDPGRPGSLVLARQAADPKAFGVVAGDPGVILGSMRASEGPMAGVEGLETSPSDSESPMPDSAFAAPVAHSGIVLCKVDAGYGAVRVGDLLTTSPTPGHAMRGDEPPLGTILGKALEPLEVGTGRIRVLITLR